MSDEKQVVVKQSSGGLILAILLIALIAIGVYGYMNGWFGLGGNSNNGGQVEQEQVEEKVEST